MVGLGSAVLLLSIFRQFAILHDAGDVVGLISQ
jgi:hypothetical protein